MKWRLSSEKLPPVGKDCNLKINNMPFSGRYWNSGNEKAIVPYEHFDVAGKSILSRLNFHIIYWLDETESPSLSSAEEAIGFAEWIISIGYDKNHKSGWYDPNERYPKYFSMNELYNLYKQSKK